MKRYTITSQELIENKTLLNKLLELVTNVYDKENAKAFHKEMMENKNIILTYITAEDNIIGLGCIAESHIAFDTFELFWGMIHPQHRGNKYGKILIEDRINYVIKYYTPKHIIVTTKSPWHLTRCGFEIIKQLNTQGEVIMYKKI